MVRRFASALLIVPPAVLLVAVIAVTYHRLDPTAGFDYAGHLDYVRYIDLTGSLPLADQGWQMYHPPAYYALAAILFEGLHHAGWGGTIGEAGRWLATAAWVLEGLAALAAVRVLGGGWIGAAAAASLVWLLPGQAIMGAMVYNETMTGLGVGLMTLGLALWWRRKPIGLGALGIGLTLALLSKYSGAVAAVIALPIILFIGRDRLRPTLLAVAPGTVLAAAFYLRNLLQFGTPTPLNAELFHLRLWDPFGWGHPPGFFTRLDLGPCAAQSSFWGGLWKWFWAADCFRLPWPSTMNGLLIAAALVATVSVVAGLGWSAFRGIRGPIAIYLVAVPVAILIAFIAYNLRVPSPTADKGVYVLAGIVPAAVATGLLAQQVTGRVAAVGIYALILSWSMVMAHASGVL